MSASKNSILAWQDVVAAKRLRRAEAIRQAAGGTVSKDSKLEDNSTPMNGLEIIGCLRRQEVSCEDLVIWHLQRWVKLNVLSALEQPT